MMDLFPEETNGGDYGAFNASCVSLVSLCPSVVGFVAEEVNYTVAFLGLAGYLLVSAALALGVARRHETLD